MSYSLAKHPNAPYEFPPPPPFAVWVRNTSWDGRGRVMDPANLGQIRHVADLAKAKKRVSDYCLDGRGSSNAFTTDWAIYKWDVDKNEYVLQYEGAAGVSKKLNALYQLTFKKGEHVERPGFEDEEAAALASIMEAMGA
jgi:hypothetical protein